MRSGPGKKRETTRAATGHHTSMTEDQFRQRVREYAALMGWGLQHHNSDSRRADPGWPDDVFCRPPRLLIVEFKSQRGRLREAQREWLVALDACGVEVALWRPSDWPEVQQVMGRGSEVRAVLHLP